MSERVIGDEKTCGCESELHGHGYPCAGTARAGERRVWGVGEVCEPCFEATEPQYRLHDLAAPGVRRRRRRPPLDSATLSLLEQHRALLGDGVRKGDGQRQRVEAELRPRLRRLLDGAEGEAERVSCEAADDQREYEAGRPARELLRDMVRTRVAREPEERTDTGGQAPRPAHVGIATPARRRR